MLCHGFDETWNWSLKHSSSHSLNAVPLFGCFLADKKQNSQKGPKITIADDTFKCESSLEHDYTFSISMKFSKLSMVWQTLKF